MKLNELRSLLTEQLRPVSFDDAAFEADCLLADTLGCGNSMLPLAAAREVDEAAERTVTRMAQRRLAGEPLQYILGEWEFYGLPFSVGPGVLIPRPETEQLVEMVLEKLKNKRNPKVLDLCAGSGCIGVTIAKKRCDAHVTLLEKSDEAIEYLMKNIDKNNVYNIKVFCGDLFDDHGSLKAEYDAIVSNPPYIRTAELASLQCEVQREPAMALDGGADGLTFYRAIAAHYAPLLKPDGFLAVEIGEEQGAAVKEIFEQVLACVRIYRDYAGHDRMVLSQYREDNYAV